MAKSETVEKNRLARGLTSAFFPVVGVGVFIFGLGLSQMLPNRTSVVGWNVAWTGFDALLAAGIIVTWWAARHRKWWAIATAGGVTALQIVDTWWSLTVFYSLKERPFIAIWAFVIQPGFAYALWRFVLNRVRISSTVAAASVDAVVDAPVDTPVEISSELSDGFEESEPVARSF